MRIFGLISLVLAIGLLGCSPASGNSAGGADPSVVAEQSVQPYPEAASVRLFVASEWSEATPDSEFLEPEGRLLTAGERAIFQRTLYASSFRAGGDGETIEAEATACFIPHHFFRYYDAHGDQIGEIAVCFCCTGIQATPELALAPAAGADWATFEFDELALRSFVESLGLPTDVNCSH